MLLQIYQTIILPIVFGNNKKSHFKSGFTICGGEETRTPVQTYSSKAFYMLICLLFVGRWQENNKPNISLAEYS